MNYLSVISKKSKLRGYIRNIFWQIIFFKLKLITENLKSDSVNRTEKSEIVFEAKVFLFLYVQSLFVKLILKLGVEF